MTSELFVTEETTVDEMLEHVRQCVENPVRVKTPAGEKIVWNFSSFDVIEEGLNLNTKKQDEFVIPFQVTSTWAMMFVLLPERIRCAENLIWRPEQNEYHAYNQFYRELTDERREQFRYDLSRRVKGDE